MPRTETAGSSESRLHECFPEFVERLASIRHEKSRSLSWIAQRTRLSRPTLSRLASGATNPLLGNIVKMARALGVPVSRLLGPEVGRASEPSQDNSDPFLAKPPQGDSRAVDIYRALCQGEATQTVLDTMKQQRMIMPGEPPDTALVRLILDLFHEHMAWIDPFALPRDRRLERRIAGRYRLPVRKDLQDSMPVRVLDIRDSLLPLIQTLAIAAVAAELLKELLRIHGILGFADGFTTSAVQLFLRRGDLHRIEAIPLVFTPQHVQFELSGTALVGSLLRTHQEYGLASTIELRDLQRKLKDVEVAVMSCGSAEKDLNSRIPRIIRSAHPELDYRAFELNLRKRGVVGDLMYHFLDKNGHEVHIAGSSRDLENVLQYQVRHRKDNDPLIFSASLDGLANVAASGVSMLLVPAPDRAAVVHAAMKRRKTPVNFLVLTRATAEQLLAMKMDG